VVITDGLQYALVEIGFNAWLFDELQFHGTCRCSFWDKGS